MGKEKNVFRERNCTWKDLWHYTFLCLRHKKVKIIFFLGKRPSATTWWSPGRGHASDFKARWNIHIFRSAEGQESDFLLHSLPAPQPREDTIKPHFQRLHRHGVLSRSLKLLLIPAWRAAQFPSPGGNRTCTMPSKQITCKKVRRFCHLLLHCPPFSLLRRSLCRLLICSWQSSQPIPLATARGTQK